MNTKPFMMDKKATLYMFLFTTYVVCFLWVNIIATKMVQVTSNLALGASALILIYPILYVISDFIQEIYGYKASRINMISSLVFSVIMIALLKLTVLLPTASDPANLPILFDAIAGTFVFSLFGAYMGDWLNDIFFEKLRKTHIPFWKRALGSSVVGQFVDSSIFYSTMSILFWHMPLNKVLLAIEYRRVNKLPNY
jgi:uncharacterized PurR-regulated membrane protein YhhQ (DUF165 family)